MRYAVFPPSLDLAPFVDCYWTLDGPAAKIAQPERILPDGCFELIFNLADPFQRTAGDGSWCNQPLSIIAGQLTHHMAVRPTGAIRLLAVRFRPAGAGHFFSDPLNAFTNQTVGAAEVDRHWGACRERLGNAPSDRRIALLEQALRERRRGVPSGSRVAGVVELIDRNAGNAKVSDLAYQAGMSVSALQRSFLRRVGVSPKTFSRILRIQAVIATRYRRPEVPLSGLAQQCGYFDHAHFDRDFVSIVGQTPTSFFGSRHELSDMLTETPPE